MAKGQRTGHRQWEAELHRLEGGASAGGKGVALIGVVGISNRSFVASAAS